MSRAFAASRLLLSRSHLRLNTVAKRFLNLHEYQSQELMRKHGIPVPNGFVAHTGEEAEAVAKKLSTPDCVVKAQVLAGGRGLGKFKNGFAGGVHIVNSPSAARDVASKMLGSVLVTKQTGEAGKPVNTVLIAQRYSLNKEAYFSIVLDRASGGPVLVGSPDGGVNIEDVAAKTPERLLKVPVNIAKGLPRSEAERMAQFIGFGDQKAQTADLIEKLYKFMIDTDATMVEINPFAKTTNGEVMVMDAKVNFDDNAEFRQKEIFEQRDYTQEDPREVQAKQFDLNYIGLDGNIGCLVNGAGLAMATMDVIQFYGGKPANFLDVGGGASQKQVTEAIKLISSDPSVKSILVNIFGGIMRCDVIAKGLIEAAADLHVPLIVRLKGTNVEIGNELLRNSGLKIIPAEDLDDAARLAVQVLSK